MLGLTNHYQYSAYMREGRVDNTQWVRRIGTRDGSASSRVSHDSRDNAQGFLYIIYSKVLGRTSLSLDCSHCSLFYRVPGSLERATERTGGNAKKDFCNNNNKHCRTQYIIEQRRGTFGDIVGFSKIGMKE